MAWGLTSPYQNNEKSHPKFREYKKITIPKAIYDGYLAANLKGHPKGTISYTIEIKKLKKHLPILYQLMFLKIKRIGQLVILCMRQEQRFLSLLSQLLELGILFFGKCYETEHFLSNRITILNDWFC